MVREFSTKLTKEKKSKNLFKLNFIFSFKFFSLMVASLFVTFFKKNFFLVDGFGVFLLLTIMRGFYKSDGFSKYGLPLSLERGEGV